MKNKTELIAATGITLMCFISLIVVSIYWQKVMDYEINGSECELVAVPKEESK